MKLFSLRRRPPSTLVMDDLLPARRGGYKGSHRDPRQADWKPAHTKAAARRRARLGHVRAEGERPDLRIEKTQPLNLDRLNQMLATGGVR